MTHPLAHYRLVYLATPYSKYKGGNLAAAFHDAAQLAARLLVAGVKVYSPIAHTHPIAMYGNLDPLDHTIWLPFDEAMMGASEALVVAQMEGWQESFGIRHEIEWFANEGRPTWYLNPKTIGVSVNPLKVSPCPTM